MFDSLADVVGHEAVAIVDQPALADRCRWLTDALRASSVRSVEGGDLARIFDTRYGWRATETQEASVVELAMLGADEEPFPLLTIRFGPKAERGECLVVAVGEATYLAELCAVGARGERTMALTRAAQINVLREGEAVRVAIVASFQPSRVIGDLLRYLAELERLRQRQDSGAADFDSPRIVSFVELTDGEQIELLWQVLLGKGALPLDDAVRMVASTLRDRGMASYQRLRQRNEVYEVVAGLLREASSQDDYFDRPVRGRYRAVLRDAGAFTPDLWRECLLATLGDEPTEREDAMRAAADYAVEHFGLNHERLRAGGRVEGGLKTAINSGIRRGLVEAIGNGLIKLASHVGSSVTNPTRDRPDDPAQGWSPPPGDLDQPLTAFLLPARLLNWANLEGIRSIRDLVKWHPDKLAMQRNLGRGTIRKTREVVEHQLGRSWESMHDEPGEDATDVSTETLTCWDEFAVQVEQEHLDLALANIDLPARMRTFVTRERILTVAELLARGERDLLSEASIGTRTLEECCRVFHEHFTTMRHSYVDHPFLDGWKRQLGRLEAMRRFVIARRATDGETLEQIGGMLGVSRERVRQVEADAISQLRRQVRWTAAIAQQLSGFRDLQAVESEVVLSAPWAAGMAENVGVLEFVLGRVVDSHWRVVRSKGRWRLSAALEALTADTPMATASAAADDRRGRSVEQVREVLEDARTSLTFAELGRGVAKRIDLSSEELASILSRPPFVRLSREHYGLLERDVPGGAAAIVAATDQVLASFVSHAEVLEIGRIHEAVTALSESHKAWTQELLASILGNDARLALESNSRWRLSADTALSPQPLVITESKTAAAQVSANALLLSRIPDEARPLFKDLLEQEIAPISQLLQEVADHLHAFEVAAQEGRPVDAATAFQLADRSRRLLDILDLSTPRRKLVQAAVRYFVLSEDGSSDFELGGLDDDARVLNAVLEHLDLASKIGLVRAPDTLTELRSHASDGTYASILNVVSEKARIQLVNLLQEDRREFSDLSAEVVEYLELVRTRTKSNHLLDIHLAERIGEACRDLLSTEPADAHARTAIQATVRYFLTQADAADDFSSPFGFEDDAHTINATLKFLGRDASSIIP